MCRELPAIIPSTGTSLSAARHKKRLHFLSHLRIADHMFYRELCCSSSSGYRKYGLHPHETQTQRPPFAPHIFQIRQQSYVPTPFSSLLPQSITTVLPLSLPAERHNPWPTSGKPPARADGSGRKAGTEKPCHMQGQAYFQQSLRLKPPCPHVAFSIFPKASSFSALPANSTPRKTP